MSKLYNKLRKMEKDIAQAEGLLPETPRARRTIADWIKEKKEELRVARLKWPTNKSKST